MDNLTENDKEYLSIFILMFADDMVQYCLKAVEKLQIKFYKISLVVRTQTPNFTVCGELGRYPLTIIALER